MDGNLNVKKNPRHINSPSQHLSRFLTKVADTADKSIRINNFQKYFANRIVFYNLHTYEKTSFQSNKYRAFPDHQPR